MEEMHVDFFSYQIFNPLPKFICLPGTGKCPSVHIGSGMAYGLENITEWG
jgi:hypothetical protein